MIDKRCNLIGYVGKQCSMYISLNKNDINSSNIYFMRLTLLNFIKIGDLQIQNNTNSAVFTPNQKNFSSPGLPFCTDFEPKKGRIFQIRGYVPHQSGRFEFDIQDGPGVQPGNIQFHFSPRFDDSLSRDPVVVRNNRYFGSWWNEERHGGSPFRRGESFEVLILIDDSDYKVIQF
ncbi:unnamed protein product [Brachionus calyciflorus]|uniref:Galectin n=1 Tax=Brachionus calyciflorus TaxID=104777 RepID=A0A814MJ82_9BILA|nr:unnamed protein product [Brachionus calyciflorus]